MSPGNAAEMELEATGRELHHTEKGTSQSYNLRGKNSLTLNCIQYPDSNSKVLDVKTRYLKMKQQDTELRQHIGLLEAELAEAHAQLKESMSDSPKVRPFPKSVAKKKNRNKDLKPVSVSKAPCSAKKEVFLEILTKSQTKEQQMKKSVSSEFPALTKKCFSEDMKTSLPKKTGRKINIGENLKLPDIKSHLSMPYLKDCSRITRSCIAVKKSVLEKKPHTSNKEYVTISNSFDKSAPTVADSEINISQNSRFLPPISKEHKVEKQGKVRSKSKELKLPDIYASNRDVLKSCPNTPSEKRKKGTIRVPNALVKLKKTKVHPQD